MGFEWSVNCKGRADQMSIPFAQIDVQNNRSLLTSQMTGDVISFCASYIAIFPFASQAQVIGRLATDVVVAKMDVKIFRIFVQLCATFPSTGNQLLNLFALIRRGRAHRSGQRTTSWGSTGAIWAECVVNSFGFDVRHCVEQQSEVSR